MKKSLSRRNFLKVSGGLAAGGLLTTGIPAFARGLAQDDMVQLRAHTRTGAQADNMNYFAEQLAEAGTATVTVEDFPSSDYIQKINTLAAGDTLGDVFWIPSIGGYARLAATGVIAPLDDLIDAAGYDLSQHYPATITGATLNGQIYGIPELAHPGRTGLFYNKTLFDEAGVDYPDDTWTYDDLLAAAIELTNPDELRWGFMDADGSYFSLLMFLRAWGGDFLSEDGTECLLNAPESIEALKYISSLYNEHQVSPIPGSAPQGPYQLFAANQLAMYQNGFWGIGVEEFVEDPSIVGVAPMPVGPSGRRGSMFEFDPIVISAGSEHLTEAFAYTDLVTGFEAQMRNYQFRGATASLPSVMAEPEVQESELMRVFTGIMEDAMPLVLPANLRETEYFKYLGDQLQIIWLGMATVDDALDDIYNGAQTILDKPSLA